MKLGDPKNHYIRHDVGPPIAPRPVRTEREVSPGNWEDNIRRRAGRGGASIPENRKYRGGCRNGKPGNWGSSQTGTSAAKRDTDVPFYARHAWARAMDDWEAKHSRESGTETNKQRPREAGTYPTIATATARDSHGDARYRACQYGARKRSRRLGGAENAPTRGARNKPEDLGQAQMRTIAAEPDAAGQVKYGHNV